MNSFNDFLAEWQKLYKDNDDGFIQLSSDKCKKVMNLGREGDIKIFAIEDIYSNEKIESSYAIDVEQTKIDGKSWFKLKLKNKAYEDVFYRLCWDLVISSIDSPTPASSIMKKFKEWQTCLQKVGNKRISFSSLMGLYGELHFLNSCLKRAKIADNIDLVLSSWQGPHGADQDFIFEDKWVEVKTVKFDADAIHISSFDQLDRDDLGYLHVIYTQCSELNGQSINDLVEEVESTFSDAVSKDKFLSLIYKVGYCNEYKQDYEQYKFNILKEFNYEVGDNFPRIRKTNLPTGIKTGRYDISTDILNTLEPVQEIF